MTQAILEGKKARAICSPNPQIGYVLVKDGKVIARGIKLLEAVGAKMEVGIMKESVQDNLTPYLSSD